jgi:hypothetical protein
MTQAKQQISIWFFVGILLLVYGVLILGAGIYGAVNPAANAVVLADLHVGIWWGALLLILGAVYSWIFYPSRRK